MRRLTPLLALALATTGFAPDAVPDRGPVASEPIERGTLVSRPGADRPPSTKTVDGDPSDWIGEPSRIGGTSRLDAGEHIYSDFLYDAFGADDGGDAERTAVTGTLADAESRTHRTEALFQAAGDQFGAPPPFGAEDHYGDVDQRRAADIAEVRWAVQGDELLMLVRTTVLTDPNALAVEVRVDGEPASFARTVVDASGYTNAFEAALPAPPGPTVEVAVVTGTRSDDGAFVPANAAYRDDEPVWIYNDRAQALAFHDGDVFRWNAMLDLAALRRGASEVVRPGPGYHERTFTSDPAISREEPEHAVLQRYGLFVPSEFAADDAGRVPATYWLHYRGGKAHSGAAWTPRLLTQLGEERGNLVITPHARGTSTWYVSKAHQDVFEAMADAEALLPVDPTRRYVSGYSMGGYGTYLFGLLYPDLFAGGFSQAGAVTQGAWTGEGPDDCRLPCFVDANGGDADAQLTYRLLENARHFPIAIDHGSDDELVPITGVQRMALRLRELGYRYRMTTFLGYEHYSQAIIDEWADGAAYLDRHRLPQNPRHVTYAVVPAFTHALNTVQAGGVTFDFRPDGAWWVDGITARDGDPTDPSTKAVVDAIALALPGEEPGLLLPEVGAASPPGHSTPYVRHGQTWELMTPEDERNGFHADLTNVATVTFHASRMGLDQLEDVVGTVTTDGTTTLTLADVRKRVEVRLDGQVVRGAWGDHRVVVEIPAGTHELVLVGRPA